jgi:hypothetical protein
LEGEEVFDKKKIKTYSLYYGQDYTSIGELSEQFGKIYFISNPGQVSELPHFFGLKEFNKIFGKVFKNTSVHVHSLVSLIYIIRKRFKDFKSEKKTEGSTFKSLY